MVEKHYRKQRALPGPDQPIEFEGEEIRLDLPMSEKKIMDNKWAIVPLIPPVVSKIRNNIFEIFVSFHD